MNRLLILLFFAGMPAASVQAGWLKPDAPKALNVDFDATGESKKIGPAVVGAPGDFWNPVHPIEGLDYRRDVEKSKDVTRRGLKYADGRPSAAAIRMINLAGGWTGAWAIHDPMFNGINYQYDVEHGNNGQPAFISLSDLIPGKYDLYLYGPIGRYQVSVNGKSYGRKDSSQDESLVNAATQWVEGVHYQRFQDILIAPNDQIEIDLIPSDNRTHDAPISGLQLVSAGSPIVGGVILGEAAQAYIQEHGGNAVLPDRGNPVIRIHRDPFPARRDANCNGCLLSDSCVPIGYRTSSGYCDVGGRFFGLKGTDVQCNNNFECLSDVCSGGQCRE